jgi:ELWxxDGT repeat protein
VAGSGSAVPQHILYAPGERIILFAAFDGETGVELWQTDGTTQGTTLVGNIAPGSAHANPAEFTMMDGTIFFVASHPDTGRELWNLTDIVASSADS